MNDDIESMLQRLAPRGPGDPLREQILAAVDQALTQRATPKWERRLRWLAAAAILFGIGLNYLVIRADRQRQEQWQASRPVPAEVRALSRMVETVSDAETSAWVEQRMLQAQHPPPNRQVPAFENNLHYIWQEIEHEPVGQDPQAPRPHFRRPVGAGIARECLSGVANRQTFGGALEQITGGG
jgi:hypothetical protein